MKPENQKQDLMHRAVRHLLVTDDDVMTEAERIVGHTLQRENLVSRNGSKVSIGSPLSMRAGD